MAFLLPVPGLLGTKRRRRGVRGGFGRDRQKVRLNSISGTHGRVQNPPGPSPAAAVTSTCTPHTEQPVIWGAKERQNRIVPSLTPRPIKFKRTQMEVKLKAGVGVERREGSRQLTLWGRERQSEVREGQPAMTNPGLPARVPAGIRDILSRGVSGCVLHGKC